MAVPVFIMVWAGSWLIWSVTIDLTTQMSSAIFAAYGKKSLTQVPPLPCCLNLVSGPWTLRAWPWSWAIGCPLVNDSGIGLPSSSASFGFQSNVSRWVGPPDMYSQMTRLAFGVW